MKRQLSPHEDQEGGSAAVHSNAQSSSGCERNECILQSIVIPENIPRSGTQVLYNHRGSLSRRFPKRIILVRHGESLGNVSEAAYCSISDWKIPLTTGGYEKSVSVGEEILNLVGGSSAPLFFYCSPYLRTKQTLHGMMQKLSENPIIGAREEPQLTGSIRNDLYSIIDALAPDWILAQHMHHNHSI